MAYVMVEDDTASMELLCFSRVLARPAAHYMKENLAVVVKGPPGWPSGMRKAPQIVCDSLYPLTTAERPVSRSRQPV